MSEGGGERAARLAPGLTVHAMPAASAGAERLGAMRPLLAGGRAVAFADGGRLFALAVELAPLHRRRGRGRAP